MTKELVDRGRASDRGASNAPRLVGKWRGLPIVGASTGALATDLMNQCATRLQALGLVYAFTFFMADFFPPSFCSIGSANCSGAR